MRLAVIGTGYVGLVSGVCFSDFGHDVICVDTDPKKIATLKSGKSPIFEPGLEALMASNVSAGRLHFTTDLSEALDGASAAFIAVGTPSRKDDGQADLTYVMQAARDIATKATGPLVVVTKSTVPVGTNRKVAAELCAANPHLEFHVASNPEFLREGAAIEDFMRPDRVVLGVESDHAARVMSSIYEPLSLQDFPIVTTDIESAELIKYASNAFLAMKISFINEMAALCERAGADVLQVSTGMGLDSRIGGKFLHAGPGYGGSCFPKDTRALAHIGRQLDVPMSITETVIATNEQVKKRMISKLQDLSGGFDGKRVTFLGVTFKPNTDDMRDAPALDIVPAVIAGGASVTIVDPEGRREGEPLLKGASWADDPYEAAKDADILVLLTEWNAFRALDLGRIAKSMRSACLADLRNIYTAKTAKEAGFSAYRSVGRGAFGPAVQ